MSNPGVFSWIRDGVRRAVLLGFSDAIEQVGGVNDQEGVSPQLAALLRQPPAGTPDNPPFEPIASRNERKRLGRSLGSAPAPNNSTNGS